jgi:hypothetical protein
MHINIKFDAITKVYKKIHRFAKQKLCQRLFRNIGRFSPSKKRDNKPKKKEKSMRISIN